MTLCSYAKGELDKSGFRAILSPGRAPRLSEPRIKIHFELLTKQVMTMSPLNFAFLHDIKLSKNFCLEFITNYLNIAGYKVINFDPLETLRELQVAIWELLGKPCPGDPAFPSSFNEDRGLFDFLHQHFQPYLVKLLRDKYINQLDSSGTPTVFLFNGDSCYGELLKKLNFKTVLIQMPPRGLPPCYEQHRLAIDHVLRHNGTNDDLSYDLIELFDKVLIPKVLCE